MNSLYIIIPAYNEEENIEKVLEGWYPIIEKHHGDGNSRLVIIDDGSKDQTFSIVEKYAKTHPLTQILHKQNGGHGAAFHGDGNSRLVIIDDGSKDQTFSIVEKYAKTHPLTQILHKQNGGHGAALLYGYEYALKQGAEFVFQTDSDGQTLPEEFEMFWKEKDEYDMVIGHRNKREDGISRVFVTKILKYVIWICFGVSIRDANTPFRLMRGDTLQRYISLIPPEFNLSFVTKILKYVIWICFGVSIRDANTPFRLMRGDTLQRYISLIPPEFNLSNVLITVIFVKQGCKVKFLPITFRPRQGGVNSINLKKIIRIGKQAMVDFWRITVIFVKQGCKVKFLPITFRPRQGGVNSINLKKIIRIGKQAMVDFWRINKVLR